MPGTAASPASDKARFENGSGEVLTAARVEALATWLVAARLPPQQRGSRRPGALVDAENGGRERRARGNADDGVHHVPEAVDARDLVGEELDEEHQAAGAEQPGRLQQGEACRQLHPAEGAGKPGQEKHGIEAQPAGPAEGGRHRHQLGGI
jgi:hypothetical protein